MCVCVCVCVSPLMLCLFAEIVIIYVGYILEDGLEVKRMIESRSTKGRILYGKHYYYLKRRSE